MKIANIGLRNNSNKNFGANIVLNDKSDLSQYINESIKAVGFSKMKEALDLFESENKYTPVKFSIKQSNFPNKKGNAKNIIVAENLLNNNKAEHYVQTNDDFYAFILELIHNNKYNKFWNEIKYEKKQNSTLLEHNVFIKTNDFNLDKYKTECKKQEKLIDEARKKSLKDVKQALKTDVEIRKTIKMMLNKFYKKDA